MMKRASGLFIFAVFLFLVCGTHAAAQDSSEPVNLTQENQEYLSEIIERLQQMELLRLSRGRLRSNPIPLPYHTIYQNLIQNQDMILENQTMVFENSIQRLNRAVDDFTDVEGAEQMRAAFSDELQEMYVLDELLEKETMLEVWREIQGSNFAMQALPVRARMYLDALRWLSVYFHGEPPAELLEQLKAIHDEQELLLDIFEMDTCLRNKSVQYAELFASVIEEYGEGGE